MTPPLRRPARPAVLTALASAAFLAQLAAPGAAPGAAAEDCRREVTGEDLPAGRPHPLIDRLGLRQAWDLATGEGVTVAVIDSGVDATHPDLAGAVLDGSQYTVVRTEDEYRRSTPAPDRDCLGHGTAVAGLVAARRSEGDRMAGVAPAARIYPVRVADGVEQATANTLATMIDDAVDAGAGVINLSLATPTDYPPVREAVERAVAADAVVVAATGNEGNEGVSGGRMYPAAYPGVLAVAAVGDDGQPLDTSNAGEWVDLAGYGEALAVPAPGGSGYRTESGTSFAAAQVSGAAALVRSRFPGLSAAEVTERLTASAAPVGGIRNDRTGAGIVDPFGALTHLGGDDGGGPGSGEGDGTGADGPAAGPGAIPVRAVPGPEPLLGPTEATAVAWSGGLLLAVVLGLLAAPAVRRAVRNGRLPATAPGPGTSRRPDTGGPGSHRPATPGTGPPFPRTDWLDGSDVPPPSAARSARTSPTHRNRTR